MTHEHGHQATMPTFFCSQRERELPGTCPPQLFWMQGEVTCNIMDAGEVAAHSHNFAATHTFRQKNAINVATENHKLFHFLKIKETHYRKQYVPVIWEPCNQNHLNLFAYFGLSTSKLCENSVFQV